MGPKEFHLGPFIATHLHTHYPVIKEQVSGHSPFSSQANILETLFKIDISFGSGVNNMGVRFHIKQFEKNHTVLILGELYI